MKLTFLGTADGIQPVSDRRHVCFTIETDGKTYWFDAGEDCTRAAHLMGVSLLATQAIFATNMGMDRIGGLPRLLWSLRKLNMLEEESPLTDEVIQVMVPSVPPWTGMIELLEGSTGNRFARDFILKITQYHDGQIFDDESVQVQAQHNSFLGTPTKNQDWHSYSLRIQAEGKAIVWTGSTVDANEFLPLLAEPCDVLILDIAHQPLADICQTLKQAEVEFGRLLLSGLSPEAINDPAHARETVESILQVKPDIPDDGTVIEL